MLSCFRTTLINFFDALQMLTTVVIVLVIFIIYCSWCEWAFTRYARASKIYVYCIISQTWKSWIKSLIILMNDYIIMTIIIGCMIKLSHLLNRLLVVHWVDYTYNIGLKRNANIISLRKSKCHTYMCVCVLSFVYQSYLWYLLIKLFICLFSFCVYLKNTVMSTSINHDN